jgi:hypothetical protein
MSDPFAGVDVRVSALGREIRTGTTQRGIHQHRVALRPKRESLSLKAGKVTDPRTPPASDANSSARRSVEVR